MGSGSVEECVADCGAIVLEYVDFGVRCDAVGWLRSQPSMEKVNWFRLERLEEDAANFCIPSASAFTYYGL